MSDSIEQRIELIERAVRALAETVNTIHRALDGQQTLLEGIVAHLGGDPPVAVAPAEPKVN